MPDFDEIYRDNLWKNKESRSGPGSTLKATETLRYQLSDLLEDYEVGSMLDIPCGDFNWMSEIWVGPGYIGADVVPEMIEKNKVDYPNVDFRVLDATKDKLPTVDMIFCRELLQHLSIQKAHQALANFILTDARWLLITSHDVRKKSGDIEDGEYTPRDLLHPPFNLPWPKAFIKDVGTKLMFLYDLDDLR